MNVLLEKSELGCHLDLFIGVANFNKVVDELVDFSIAKKRVRYSVNTAVNRCT